MREKEEQEEKIIEQIKQIYLDTKGTYGVNRMNEELKRKDIFCNHKKVYRLMSENGYLSVVKRKKAYRKPGKPHPKHNVLERNFKTSLPSIRRKRV